MTNRRLKTVSTMYKWESNRLNNFAISSVGIGTAMQKSASALHVAGNDINESIGLIVAANSVVQNPEQVGTALKTMSMRLRGAKAELEEAGEATDGMCDSTSELQAKLKSLTGVDIMLNGDTFKDTFQIIGEMSKVWDRLTDINKAAALELMGGKRQGNILESMIQNFEDAENASTTAMNSTGSAINENEKYLNSINGKIQIFKASFESFSTNFLNSELVKGIVSLGSGIMNVADGLAKTDALLPAIIAHFVLLKKHSSWITPTGNGASGTVYNGILGGLFAGKSNLNTLMYGVGKNSFRKFNTMVSTGDVVGMNKYINAIKEHNVVFADYLQNHQDGSATLKGYQQSIKGVTTGINGSAIAAWGANVAFSALNMAMTMVVSMAVVAAFKFIADAIETTKEKAQSAEEALNAFNEAQNTLKSNKASIEEFSDEYKTLAKGVNSLGENISLSSTQFDRYHEITNQIAEMFPEMVQGWDKQGNAIIKNKGNVDALTEAYERLQDKASLDLIEKADDIFDTYENKTNPHSGTVSFMADILTGSNSIKDQINILEELFKHTKDVETLSSWMHSSFFASLENQDDLSTLETIIKDLNIDVGAVLGVSGTNGKEDAQAIIDNLSLIQDKYKTLVDDLNRETSKVKPLTSELLKSSLTYDALDEESKKIMDAFVSNLDYDWYERFDFDENKVKVELERIMRAVQKAGVNNEFNLSLTADTQWNNNEISYEQWKSKIDAVLKLFPGDENKEIRKSIKVLFDYQDNKDSYKRARDKLRGSDGAGGRFTADGSNGSIDVDEVLGGLNKGQLETFLDDTVYNKIIKWCNKPNNINKSATEIANYIKKVIDKASNSSDDSFDSLFSGLDVTSEAFGDLDKAFAEISKSGKITFSTLNDIQDKFSELEGIKDGWLKRQINGLVNAGNDTEKVNEILGNLAVKYIETKIGADDLATANQNVVASMLREQGVANADTVALQMIAKAKLEAAFEGEKLASITNDEFKALINEGYAAGLSSESLSSLWLKKQVLNGYKIDTTKDVEQILNIAKASGITGKAVDAMTTIVEASKSIAFDKNSPYSLVDILKARKSLENIVNSDFPIKFDPVKFTGATQDKNSSSSSDSSSSDSDTKSEDKWLNARQRELDKAKHQLEMGKITETKYLEKVEEIENKFAPEIKKRQNKIAKLRKKYNALSDSGKKTKNGKKLKKQLDEEKKFLQEIRKKDQELDEEIHNLILDDKKEKYEKYEENQIQRYIDGKIDAMKLKENLKAKIKKLFKGFDKETLNELLDGLDTTVADAIIDRFDKEIDDLDTKRNLDLISEEDYYKDKFTLAKEYYEQNGELADKYKDALVDAYEYAKDKYIESLEDQKDAASDFFDEQKQLLQDNSDEESYKKDQAEKRKTVNDLKMQIAELEKDTSEKSKKRIAELQNELIEAEDELSQFEKEYALDKTIATLEEVETQYLKSIDEKISSIEENTAGTYQAIRSFASTLGIELPENPTAYAKGTSSSIGGLVLTQEAGSEVVGINKLNGFTLLTPNSMVWSNEQTKKLWEFSKNPNNLLKQYFNNSNKNNVPQINSINAPTEYNVIVQKGAVVISGENNKNVIKNAGKELAYEVLTQLKKYK